MSTAEQVYIYKQLEPNDKIKSGHKKFVADGKFGKAFIDANYTKEEQKKLEQDYKDYLKGNKD